MVLESPEKHVFILTSVCTVRLFLELKDWLNGWLVQEQPDTAADSQKLDDDEDRQNPAYVPRKGAFFEHDLRRGTVEDSSPKTSETKPYVCQLLFLSTFHSI